MATPQQFCVRWNSHLGSLGAAFPQLLAGGRFVDCTLACEGRKLSCHRLVLAACSGFFENLLGENPCQHPIIILKDVRFWELQALVDFMYKGEVNVTQEGLQDLLKCAETLQIRGLSGADSALKNLSQSASKSEDECNTVNSNHHLNNVVKEETVPYQEEKEAHTTLGDSKSNLLENNLLSNDHHNNVNEPDVDSADSRYSNEGLDEEMAMNIKEEFCIEDGPMNKTQAEPYIKVKDTSLLFKEELLLDNNSEKLYNSSEENPNFIYPPQLHYNKEVMAIIPCAVKTQTIEKEPTTKNAPINNKIYLQVPMDGRVNKRKLNPAFVNTKTKFISENELLDAASNRIRDLDMKQDLMNIRTGSFRTYDNESLWNALMDIKGGSSIYRASQVYNVPRKTLRNWMKRWDIKSSYPMPRQLKQFIENMKSKKQT